jgi:hypothetical protein
MLNKMITYLLTYLHTFWVQMLLPSAVYVRLFVSKWAHISAGISCLRDDR